MFYGESAKMARGASVLKDKKPNDRYGDQDSKSEASAFDAISTDITVFSELMDNAGTLKFGNDKKKLAEVAKTNLSTGIGEFHLGNSWDNEVLSRNLTFEEKKVFRELCQRETLRLQQVLAKRFLEKEPDDTSFLSADDERTRNEVNYRVQGHLLMTKHMADFKRRTRD